MLSLRKRHLQVCCLFLFHSDAVNNITTQSNWEKKSVYSAYVSRLQSVYFTRTKVDITSVMSISKRRENRSLQHLPIFLSLCMDMVQQPFFSTSSIHKDKWLQLNNQSYVIKTTAQLALASGYSMLGQMGGLNLFFLCYVTESARYKCCPKSEELPLCPNFKIRCVSCSSLGLSTHESYTGVEEEQSKPFY